MPIQATFVSDMLAKTTKQGAQPLRTKADFAPGVATGRATAPTIIGMPFTSRPWSALAA